MTDLYERKMHFKAQILEDLADVAESAEDADVVCKPFGHADRKAWDQAVVEVAAELRRRSMRSTRPPLEPKL